MKPTLKILVLEDEARLRRLYRHDLELDGYRVVTRDSTTGGLEAVEDASPDMVVLDVEQPEHGIESLRLLTGRCPRIPVLAILRETCSTDASIRGTADAWVRHSADTGPLRSKIRQLFSPEAC